MYSEEEEEDTGTLAHREVCGEELTQVISGSRSKIGQLMLTTTAQTCVVSE